MKAGIDDATVVVPRYERVEVLEMKVGSLEELPVRMAAVESQIVLLRTEVHGEFSAVRQEMRALNEETKAEMRMLHEEVLDRISTIGEGGQVRRRRKR